jgi:uncharacterized delta-60 repeat protein
MAARRPIVDRSDRREGAHDPGDSRDMPMLAPDRREVLGAAGVAALGITALSLPRAANAASPDWTPLAAGRTTAAGDLDLAFNVDIDFQVDALAIDSQQRVVLGGAFTSIGGTTVNRVARVALSGVRDTSFDPNVGGASAAVHALGLDGDGRIVLGGSFTSVKGVARTALARVDALGDLDEDFSPVVGVNPDFFGATAPVVRALLVDGDGSIVLGGNFGDVGGATRRNLARVLADGNVASDIDLQPDDIVEALAFQTIGSERHLLVGGLFTEIGGTGRMALARLNANGSLDTTFDANVESFTGVYALAVQPDGKILIGGDFTTVGGTTRSGLARLHANGDLDTTFDADVDGVLGPVIYAIAVQSDGRIVIGGNFTSVGGQERTNIARLEANGALDTTFDPGASNDVYALAIPSDGSIILGGAFGQVDGTDRTRLARLV